MIFLEKKRVIECDVYSIAFLELRRLLQGGIYLGEGSTLYVTLITT